MRGSVTTSPDSPSSRTEHVSRPERAADGVEQAFEQIAAPDHEHDTAWVVRGEGAGSPHDPVVFHVHPTSVPVDPSDPSSAAEVDAVVRAQVAPFGGRVWSPRYRQASTRAFQECDGGGEEAYHLAYRDVSAAFAQFLVDEALVDERLVDEHLVVESRPVRPLVLVGHGQGARHVRALLAEFFDHDGLADRLVAACLIGTDLAVDDAVLTDFHLATDPDASGVVVAHQTRLGSDVLAADVRRRTAAWLAARAAAPDASGGGYADGAVPYWPGVCGTVVTPGGRGAEPWHVVDLSGAEDALPLVLLHKLGGWVADWRGVAEELARERRVVVVDLPGHGGSTRCPPTPWALWPAGTAQGLASLLGTLDIDRAHVMGCSLGGVVGTLLAAAEPERVASLALVGTSLTQRFTAARTLEVDRAVRGGFGRGWVPRPGQNTRAVTGDPAVLAEQDASRAWAGRWVRPSERGVGLTGVEHLLAEVRSPTLYLNGEYAGYRVYEEVAQRLLPRVQVEVVPGCGSFPHQEQPRAVAARWRGFVGSSDVPADAG